MQNQTQELVENSHVSSSMPTYHAQNHHGSGGDREFSFWCAQSNTESSRKDSNRLIGKSGGGKGFKSKHSTLMPRNPHCYSGSRDSRSQAIAESRKELMQNLQDLPDSAFELSFQYMVQQQQQQQQQALQPVQNEAFIDKIKISFDEDHVRKQDKKDEKEKNNNNNKPNQILRVKSMENDSFLLKMFFPSSLDWKKAKVGSVPKLSPAPSFYKLKQTGKEQRTKSSQAGDNRSDLNNHTDESTNDSRKRRSKGRYVDGNFSRGCWPFHFFLKAKKQGGSR